MLAALFLAAAALADLPAAAIHTVPVDGHPFGLVVTADSRHLLATIEGKSSGIAAFGIAPDGLRKEGFVALDGTPTDFALAPEGDIAVVTTFKHIYFVDTQKLIAGGDDAVLGRVDTSGSSVNAAVSPDGKIALVSEEGDGTVSVLDIAAARAGHFKHAPVLGHVAVGTGPIGIAFDSGAQYAYVTVQRAAPGLNWPETCAAESPGGTAGAQGAILTLNLKALETRPNGPTILGIAPAGCVPVRLALSADGDRVFVTARGDGKVMAFDRLKLASDPKHARIAEAVVGSAPVGIAASSRAVFATLSARFSDAAAPSSVIALNPSDLTPIATIPAGNFPRELALTADGRWLFIGNFNSGTLEQVDLTTLPQDSGAAVIDKR